MKAALAFAWIMVVGCASVPPLGHEIHRRTASTEEAVSRYQLGLVDSTVFNGGLIRVRLSGWEEPGVRGYAKFEGRKAPFFELTEKGSSSPIYEAWLGVPYSQAAGESEVEVGLGEEGSEKIERLPLSVRVGTYPSQSLRIDPRIASPDPEDAARIDREAQETRAIYQQASPVRYWTEAFALPLKSKIRSVYGLKRVYNGIPSGYHAGFDFKATWNTPIPAAADGKVALAKNLFLCGNAVILDHGAGVHTVYCHMKRFRVKPGDLVKKSQIIGLVGSSGRSTGPHLHWGTVVGGVSVNPVDVLKATSGVKSFDTLRQ